MNYLKRIYQLLIFAALVGCNYSDNGNTADNNSHTDTKKTNGSIWPKINSPVKVDPNVEAEIQKLLIEMTLEQKIAQMIQPEIRDISVEDMRRYGFGSYLNGGGAFPNNNKHSTPGDWIALAEKMYQASIDDSLDGINIPTMWGTDAVHGHNNVIGATLFPHNIGLGAMNNPKLMEKIATITATEVMVTGIDWVFAPTVATVRDDRWGRTYEGYSEHPEIVKSYAAAVVKGLQGQPGEDFLADNRVISTVKHFVGDGGTVNGDDQGNNLVIESDLFRLHAQGYVGGLGAGAQTVMASFNSWKGDKIHGNRYLLTEVLKNKMGFDGLVVGDWNGHGQVVGCTNANCPQAINAGLDIFMVPTDAWKPLLETTITQVKTGVIPIQRIDDAVARILRVKLRAGLFTKPSPAQRMYSGQTELIGSQQHRKVARQAVRESMVLLKNNNATLPIDPTINILVTGDGADNIGKQSGGWTITWQGTGNHNDEFPGGTSIYQGLAKQVQAAGGTITLSPDAEYDLKPDLAIVVFGEDPYAEGQGDLEHLEFEPNNKKSLLLLKKLKAQQIPVVSLFISGRPMWVNPELNASDAFVAVWLPGSEGEGIADVILKGQTGQPQYDFSGKLSFSWPNHPLQNTNWGDQAYDPLFAYGYGLTFKDNEHLTNQLPDNFETKEYQQVNAHTQSETSNLTKYTLFNGSIKSPWGALIYSENTQREIIANVQKVKGIKYRTVDKEVQEDAIRLSFDGASVAGFKLFSQSSVEQSIVLDTDAKTQLKFSLKIDQPIEGKINLSMDCNFDNDANASRCGKQVAIEKELAPLTKGDWHSFAVDIACFKNANFNLSRLTSPFSISANAPNQISLADISFAQDPSSSSNISCN